MSELVERLRGLMIRSDIGNVVKEAADRIEKLENELADQGNDWFKEECRLKDRIEELERAGRSVIDAVNRTADHTEWFEPISKLRAVLEKKS